jgi:hypothetical protein
MSMGNNKTIEIIGIPEGVVERVEAGALHI